MKSMVRLGLALLAGCAAAPPSPTADDMPVIAAPAAPSAVSIGAMSGHGTILDAPPDAAAVAAAPLPKPANDGRGWYAQQYGLTEAEARARQAEQGRLQGAFATLMNRLRRAEPDNFVGAMLRHAPSWDYVFFFKRDPGGTLARYTKEPHFKAEAAVYSEADRARLIEPWGKRWSAEGIPFGYGLDAVYATMDVQLGIDADSYRALAAARGWGDPPAPIVLGFAKGPIRPAVDPRVAPLLRGFAHEKFATLMQLEALGTGKLVLRDGCLRLDSKTGLGPVAVFHYETGIGLDGKGYLALIDRMTGKVRGRVGETLAWGAPNAIPDNAMVGLAELRAACPGELINIGNPESKAVFDARYAR